MTFKVINYKLAGQLVGISTEDVQFSPEGVGELQSEAIYNEVLKLPNFLPFEDKEGDSEESNDDQKDTVEPDSNDNATDDEEPKVKESKEKPAVKTNTKKK